MTLVAVGTAKASPGASTLCLALGATWPTDRGTPLIIEADPDGGSLAARMALGYEPGLVSLAAAARRGVDEPLLRSHSQAVTDGLSVICGPASPHQAHAALAAVADRLVEQLGRLSGAAVVDVGRVGPSSPSLPLARGADLCLLVCRPRLDEIQHVRPRARALEQVGCRVGLVCIGATPYSPLEVAESAGVELVGVVADDPKGAAMLCGGPGDDRALRRSLLWRTAGDLASTIAVRVADRRATTADRAMGGVGTREAAG